MTQTISVARWYDEFRRIARRGRHADVLSSSASAENLTSWTSELTSVAIETCSNFGWLAVGRGHPGAPIPISKQEYLGIDVLAFLQSESVAWKVPTLALELENLRATDNIAYSVWKVAMVRAAMRGVFCYRRSAEEVGPLIEELSAGVMKDLTGSLKIDEPLILVVGTRAEADSFPDGFFHPYYWTMTEGRFRRLTGG